MSSILLGLGMIILTIVMYAGATYVYRRLKWPIVMPVLTTTVVLVLILVITDISLDTYMLGGNGFRNCSDQLLFPWRSLYPNISIC